MLFCRLVQIYDHWDIYLIITLSRLTSFIKLFLYLSCSSYLAYPSCLEKAYFLQFRLISALQWTLSSVCGRQCKQLLYSAVENYYKQKVHLQVSSFTGVDVVGRQASRLAQETASEQLTTVQADRDQQSQALKEANKVCEQYSFLDWVRDIFEKGVVTGQDSLQKWPTCSFVWNFLVSRFNRQHYLTFCIYLISSISVFVNQFGRWTFARNIFQVTFSMLQENNFIFAIYSVIVDWKLDARGWYNLTKFISVLLKPNTSCNTVTAIKTPDWGLLLQTF